MLQQDLALPFTDADTDAQTVVRLAGPADVEGFRREARRLLALRTAPESVVWRASEGGDEPSAPSMPSAPDASAADIRVPAAFVELCGDVLLHHAAHRFALMYRLLWRLLQEPALRHDPLDADVMEAQQLARAVRRDIHKMRAFVRFTAIGDGRHIAWFEPAHHIVEANADFFRRRFAQMHWAILTPARSVAWDGQRLRFGPGAQRADAPPPDAGEALWLTYYQHIFNPARLKLAMMTKEMPRRYWHNLPEAALIAPLAAAAQARSEAMVEAPSTPARRFRPIVPLRALPPADAPADLRALQATTNACHSCPIGALATQAVCGEGPLAPQRMLVGEQPGDAEDLAGRPFVGPAGQLLDRALAQLGWPRESVYLANAVKHFKYELRGQRRLHKTAAQREVEACLHWLDHEIALVQPQRLVALGATAARALLGRPVAVLEERGHWLHERADGRPVLMTRSQFAG
jgi:probable DNA metabolism protein